MAFMVGNFVVQDYATFKELFDSDPAGRKETAKGYILLRSVDDPNEVFVRVEFDSADKAKAFREKLRASGALANVNVKTLAVTEKVDEGTY
jgi:heme-degrading monooxygenase HmoA